MAIPNEGTRMKLSSIAATALATALLLPSGAALAQDDPTPPATIIPVTEGALAEAFPVEVGGVLLADSLQILTSADFTADDEASLELLQGAADELGIDIGEITIGSAFTSTELDAESGVFLVGIHVPGMNPEMGRQLLLDLFTAEADDDLVISEGELAERDVVIMSDPEDPSVAAYIYADGDMAWMLAAPVEAELIEAITQLP